MEKDRYKFLRESGATYNLPIFLEASVDEMGVMVGFDGGVEQVDQTCNFTYTQSGNTVRIFNTVNANKTPQLLDIIFTVEWGDGTKSDLYATAGTQLNSVSKTYDTQGDKRISIYLDTPWGKYRTTKIIPVPVETHIPNPFGKIEGFIIPYTSEVGEQEYLNDLDYTNNDGDAIIKFAAFGASRISEKKLYGANKYEGVTVGTVDNMAYSGYTIDNLYYRDFEDGITYITGTTTNYQSEEVFNKMLTRNEHFIGFIDEPLVYSDIFVERGKQSVLEKTHRLGEIDNMGELDVYGNGYFNVRKQ